MDLFTAWLFNEQDQPLAYANLVVKGTALGAMSEDQGRFVNIVTEQPATSAVRVSYKSLCKSPLQKPA